MRLTVLDKHFWRHYFQCPRSACFLYAKNPQFGVRTITKKEKTPEEEINNILETVACHFFIELSKGEVEYKEMKKIYLLAVRIAKKRWKRGSRYYEVFKEVVDYLRTEEPLKELLELLDVNDSENIEVGSTIKLLLNNFFYKIPTFNLKYDHFYKVDVPLFSRKDGKIKLFKFIHSGYPHIIFQEDYDLNITRFVANELFEEEVEEIIVYDFKTMKRYSVKPEKSVYFADVFKILRTIESDLIPRYVLYDNCINCSNTSMCKEFSELFSEGDKFLDVIKTWKKKNE